MENINFLPIINSIIYSVLGVVIFTGFLPDHREADTEKTWHEIANNKNVALAIIFGSFIIEFLSSSVRQFMDKKGLSLELLLLSSVFVIATCGLIYELVAGALASYLLGDSVKQFSFIIGVYLFSRWE